MCNAALPGQEKVWRLLDNAKVGHIMSKTGQSLTVMQALYTLCQHCLFVVTVVKSAVHVTDLACVVAKRFGVRPVIMRKRLFESKVPLLIKLLCTAVYFVISPLLSLLCIHMAQLD